ncbi:hypothetical protein [Streptomyces violaceusniger]|uniref:Uncharacterized protein n=1 Tax=Streptomyces violaceusniger (strain Tu 4113) TaxID=653045 RepID=G2PGV4_STRV4|nr:hypothetical protein [Streptomyces violaceusniger]AEM88668.1 hypothetical protein Strvi_9412 [Streptomyces violaceusniger Tu 4113]
MTLGTSTETYVLDTARDGQRILAGINGDAAYAVETLISEYLELRDQVQQLKDGLPQHHTDPELCPACDALAQPCPYHAGRAEGWIELSKAVRLVAGDDSTYATLVMEHADAAGDDV